MKKMLCLLASFSMLSTPIFIVESFSNNKTKNFKQKNITEHNLSTLNNGYNPMYPNQYFNVNTYGNFEEANISGGGKSKDRTSSKSIASFNIDWRNYANSKQTFIKNYSLQFNCQCYSYFEYHNDNSDNNYDNFNYSADIGYGNISETEKYKRDFGDGQQVVWYGYSVSWISDYVLKVEASSYAHAWKGFAGNHHMAKTRINLKDVTLVSKFDLNNFQNKISSSLGQSFNLKSDTSALISSKDTTSVNGNVESNYDLITDEINKRLKKSFGEDYNSWFGTNNNKNKPLLELESYFDDKNSIVNITLKDESDGIINDQFVISNIQMKINLTLTDNYWQKNIQERLQITPGKIVDPTDSYNSLIEDNPEYHPENDQTYVYHNSVNLSFSAKKGSNEILSVNGIDVPVYDDNFIITLSDPKMTNNSKSNLKSDDGTYKVVVKDGQTKKMEINIVISSVTSALSFKWVGWNPKNDPTQSEYYNQYLLITPNVDGKKNDKYDPTINSKTGTREQIIGVNYNFNDPFAFDPLNKYGNIISNSKDYQPFYIAQASVVNSGIVTIAENLNSIAKIERVKVNPLTLEELGNREVVNTSEAQFSTPGLWRYIIHVKNHVEKKVDPHYPDGNEVNAIAGSTISQFLLIDNSAKSYATFLNQESILNNKNIFDFKATIQWNHLKFYLVNDKYMSSGDISNLTFSQLIAYWNEYVSDCIQQKVKIDPNPVNYKDLSKLEITTFLLNSFSEEDIKKRTKEYVAKQMAIFSPKALYKDDYLIYFNDKEIDNADLSDFVLPQDTQENEIKKTVTMYIVASENSTLLENKKDFKLINDNKYNPEKCLDLSTIPFQNLTYNFSLWTDEQKNNFLNNYVFEQTKKYLDAYKPKKYDGNYLYGDDYFISLKGVYGIDLKIDDSITQILKDFFESSKPHTLTFTIYSAADTINLTGYNKFTITNDPNSPNPAPDFPPEPPEPNPVPKAEVKSNSNIVWWFIFGIILAIILTFGTILIFIKRRKYKKIKK